MTPSTPSPRVSSLVTLATSFFSVVDHEVGAAMARVVGLCIGCGADHPGAARFGDLRRIMADRRPGASDEQRLAGDRPVQPNRLQRRERRNAEACARRDLDAVGQFHRLFGGQHAIFRRCAEGALPLRVPQPHPLADVAVIDAVADRIDHACAVAMRDDAWPCQWTPTPALHVGRVDAGHGDFHANLAGARLGRIHVADRQYVARRTVAFVPGSLHPCGPPPAQENRSTNAGQPFCILRLLARPAGSGA